ncbi:MAG: carboxypeptidase-like regulatory domain-containing protein, partial [Mariniphaga sp.]|nr:carboxypeptidase-like regulatory domain-containing protein [Mariniphaga sp.]
MKKLLLIGLVLCVVVFTASAQTKQITGKVTSKDDGAPIPGVSVVVSGTSTGTITDADGKFTLTVPENELLLFSFVGLKTVEVTVTSATIYNVEMEQEIIGMDEVMVVAYGIAKKESFTGSA